MSNPPHTSLPPTIRLSLAQQCASVLQSLYSLQYDIYLFPDGIAYNPSIIDPVSTLWDCLKLGAPLCALYNRLGLSELEVPDVSDVPKGGGNNHKCKAATYRFLVACKDEFGLNDDQRFDVRDLYNDDTTGLVKVLKTINILLDKLVSRRRMPERRSLPVPLAIPSDTPSTIENGGRLTSRDLVTTELLQSERSYVSSLEELQSYQNLVYQKRLLSTEVARNIFGNLNELLDFQRRFLVQLEACLARSKDEQRIGPLFLENEEGFKVYGPYCVNYINVNQILPNHIGSLQSLANVIEPTRGLPSYLIKPIQRLGKYPLLLKQLITFSEGTKYLYTDELKRAEECCNRIAETINEAKRIQEMTCLRDKLAKSVEDWKGLDIREFGDLQLADKFMMEAHDVEREYHLFLFNKILLCCKEVPTKKKLAKKPAGNRTSSTEEVERFTLKGNIYIHAIADVKDSSSRTSSPRLKVYWQDGPDLENFTIKTLNDEQKKLWKTRIVAMVEEAKLRRRSLPGRNPNSTGAPLNLKVSKSPLVATPLRSDFITDPDYDSGFVVSSQGLKEVYVASTDSCENTPDRPIVRSMSSPPSVRATGESPYPAHMQRKYSNVDSRVTIPLRLPNQSVVQSSVKIRAGSNVTLASIGETRVLANSDSPPSPIRSQNSYVSGDDSGLYSPSRAFSMSTEDRKCFGNDPGSKMLNPQRLHATDSNLEIEDNVSHSIRRKGDSDDNLDGYARIVSKGDNSWPASAYGKQEYYSQQHQPIMPLAAATLQRDIADGDYGYSTRSSTSTYESARIRRTSGNTITASPASATVQSFIQQPPPLPSTCGYLPSPPSTPANNKYTKTSKSCDELRHTQSQRNFGLLNDHGSQQLMGLVSPIPMQPIDGNYNDDCNEKVSVPPRSASNFATSLRLPVPSMDGYESVNHHSHQPSVQRSITLPNLTTSTRIKFHLGRETFLIGLSGPDYNLFELLSKIDKKLKTIGRSGLRYDARLTYKDEDGDLISMRSDEDLGMAVEVARMMSGSAGGGAVDVYIQ